MSKLWLRLSDRFNALKPRERGILFALAAGCLCALMYFVFLEPAMTRRDLYQRQLKQNETKLAELREQHLALLQQSLQDPDAARHQQLNALLQNNQTLRDELSSAQAKLAPPERMQQLLADLLARQPGLELISVKTLEPENLLDKPADAAAAPSVAGAGAMAISPIALPAPTASAAAAAPADANRPKGVYRHGLEVTVRGNYLNLAAYARRVEQLPWRLYWGPMDLQVERYPNSRLTFTIYTLSLDPAWLSL